jgi:ligand-binding sensor protein
MSKTFQEIVDIQKWQVIQNHFSEVLGVCLRTVNSQGKFLTAPSCSMIFTEVIVKSALIKVINSESYLETLIEQQIDDWQEGLACFTGGRIFLIPLEVEQTLLAYIVVGPVLIGRLDDAGKKVIANELSIAPELVSDVLRDIKAFSFKGIEALLDLLSGIGHYVCEAGINKPSIQALSLEVPHILADVNKTHLDNLLKTLLEVACKFAQAERGSVMLLDHPTNELYIKLAQGIDSSIMETARVKMGEGLAGLVAQTGKPLVITPDNSEPLIQERLNNPSLKYSILLPLKTKNHSFGVLSVASSDSEAGKLKTQSQEISTKLDQLIQTTLSDLVGKTL